MPKKPRKGGPGKFEGNAYPDLAEVMYAASLDSSWCDVEGGDVQASQHGCLIRGPMGRSVLNLAKDEQIRLSKEERNVAQKAKCALVTTDSNGFVSVDFSTSKKQCGEWAEEVEQLETEEGF